MRGVNPVIRSRNEPNLGDAGSNIAAVPASRLHGQNLVTSKAQDVDEPKGIDPVARWREADELLHHGAVESFSFELGERA